MSRLTPTCEPVDPCSNTNLGPSSQELFRNMRDHDYFIFPFCCCCAAFCFAVFIRELLFMNKYYLHNMHRRRKTMIVLSLYPVCSITSLLSLFVPRSVTLMELLSSSYLSFVLYTFLHLVPDYFGGLKKMFQKLNGVEVSRRPKPCCFVCLPPTPFSDTLCYIFLIFPLLILQVTLVRPGISLLAAVLWMNGFYNPGSGESDNPTIYLRTMMGMSNTLAIYGLRVLMLVADPHLPNFYLKPKFISIQIVLVTTNLLGMIMNITGGQGAIPCLPPFSPTARASQITHIMLVIQMVPFSIIGHFFYLRRAEYESMEEENRADSQIDLNVLHGSENSQAACENGMAGYENKQIDCKSLDNTGNVVTAQPITIVAELPKEDDG